jgi:hypothetical protein
MLGGITYDTHLQFPNYLNISPYVLFVTSISSLGKYLFNYLAYLTWVVSLLVIFIAFFL